jgi:hypothetical protein
MKGARLLDGTLRNFPPSVLLAMRHALVLSWARLGNRFDSEDPPSTARLTLANIIVGLAEHDAQTLPRWHGKPLTSSFSRRRDSYTRGAAHRDDACTLRSTHVEEPSQNELVLRE